MYKNFEVHSCTNQINKLFIYISQIVYNLLSKQIKNANLQHLLPIPS